MAGKSAKRGRPPGSKNHEYVPVYAQPVCCPNCSSTNLAAIKGAKPIERARAGTAPDGTQFTVSRWQRSRCVDCNQTMVIITRLSEKK